MMMKMMIWLGEVSTTPPAFPLASTILSTQDRQDMSWDVPLSPVRETPGAIRTRTFYLVRFSCLSPTTLSREADIIVVRV